MEGERVAEAAVAVIRGHCANKLCTAVGAMSVGGSAVRATVAARRMEPADN
jgi:hypothetical protein